MMKRINMLCAVMLLPLLMYAQPMNSEVSVTINGNKNLQINLDGKAYNFNAGAASVNSTSFTMNNLSLGQHTYLISRTDNSTNTPEKITAIVNLRYGYDITLVLNEDGSLELMESRKDGYTSVARQPIGDAAFNTLLQRVKVQKSTAARRAIVAAAFENADHYFSTLQVEQLLRPINSESFRLSLAKDAFSKVTDPYNFGSIYRLLTSEASKKNLDTYVSTFEREPVTTGAMADAAFKRLYQGIQQQWPVSAQINSLNSTFSNTNNFFTTYQAAQLIQLVSTESDRLKLAKASYSNITDKANFSQVYELLNTQNSRNELDNHVKAQGGTTAGQGGTTAGSAMSEANFTNLFNAIQQQWPVSAQMNSLNDVFNNTNNFFSTNQAVQLIKLVSAEAYRLQLAKAAYRNTTDKANYRQVSDLLNTQNSKNELIEYVRSLGTTETTTNAKQALSDASFNKLLQTIQMQFLPFEKLNTISDLFNNATDYFSTAQAKQLIELTTSENNRLSLAKMSYKKITDRNNFSQLYDILPTQAYRNDLANYVKNYRD